LVPKIVVIEPGATSWTAKTGGAIGDGRDSLSSRMGSQGLDHYLDVLTKKPGALAGSTALEQCRAQRRWPASYDLLWGMLKERDGKQAGTRAMIDVLLIGREYGPARLRRTVEEALELGCPNVGSIRYPLNGTNLEQRPAASAMDIGVLSRYDRPQPDLRKVTRARGVPHACEIHGGFVHRGRVKRLEDGCMFDELAAQ
jgi:hypothetical protein